MNIEELQLILNALSGAAADAKLVAIFWLLVPAFQTLLGCTTTVVVMVAALRATKHVILSLSDYKEVATTVGHTLGTLGSYSHMFTSRETRETIERVRQLVQYESSRVE